MRHLLTLALLSALALPAGAAQIYKWVDAQGVTHFDAQPPTGQNATSMDAPKAESPGPAAPSSTALPQDNGAARQREINNKVKAQVRQQEAQRQDWCDKVRTNLAQLQNNPRVRAEIDGDFKRLDENQRQSKIKEMQDLINKNCQ